MAVDPQLQSQANQASALLDQYGEWIDRYRGGMSRELAAVVMLHESGGNFNAPGDPSLGEVGYYQVANYVPGIFGLPAEARNDPETNVAVGLGEYNYEAARWKLFNDAVQFGTPDSWKLARLTFSIGRGGAQQLAQMAGATTPGGVFDDIVAYVNAHGAPQLGSQSPAKVVSRVNNIVQQMATASLMGSNSFGPPTVTPPPPGYEDAWTMPPADVADLYTEPLEISTLLLLGGVGVLLYYVWKRSR